MNYKTHVLTPSTLVVILENGGAEKVYSFSSNSPTYSRFKIAFESGDLDAIPVIVDPTLRVADQIGANVKIDNGVMSIDGEDIPAELADEIRKATAAGLDTTGLKAFWQRLKKNPSPHAIKQTFRFIKKNGSLILRDGRFVLYKGVKKVSDGVYKAMHGTGEPFVYTLGQMAQERGGRNVCDGSPSVACGRGLHAAPWGYVGHYYGGASRISLICDPEDVVGVPYDGDSQKMRLWQVLPTAEVDSPISEAAITTKHSTGVIGKITKAIVNVIKKDDKSIKVPLTTDRITLPVEFMTTAGFQRDSTVWAAVTDKRARFVRVSTPEVFAGNVFNKEVKMLSSGAFSLRLAVLREAKIGDGTAYVAKIEGPGIIHIRKA